MRLSKLYQAFGVIAVLLGPASSARADTFTLDHGNIGVSGDQMTITRLPIVKPDGRVVYKDVIIKFRLTRRNALVVVNGFPKTTNSPRLLIGNFDPGRYVFNNTTNTVELEGPGAGPNGRAVWTLTGVGSSLEMTFYAGPVEGHPLQARLNAAGIESSPAMFGVSSHNGPLSSNHWGFNKLIALTNVQGDLLIQSHTFAADSEVPLAALTLHKEEPAP